MPTQLPLPVRLPDEASFANFLVCAQNRAAVEALHQFLAAGHGSLFLHGPPGSGRTHLLHACCHAVEARGGAIVYLPLGELQDAPPAELLAGLEAHALVCLDDADAVAGRRHWEEALFHLYNRCLETGCRLLLALPVSAVIMVLLRHVHERYRASRYYGPAVAAQEIAPGASAAVETAPPPA